MYLICTNFIRGQCCCVWLEGCVPCCCCLVCRHRRHRRLRLVNLLARIPRRLARVVVPLMSFYEGGWGQRGRSGTWPHQDWRFDHSRCTAKSSRGRLLLETKEQELTEIEDKCQTIYHETVRNMVDMSGNKKMNLFFICSHEEKS